MGSVDSYYKANKRSTKKAINKAIKEVNRTAEDKKGSITSIYDDAIAKTKIQGAQAKEKTEQQYQRSYDMNAVSRLVAERQLKEKMANSGLTQSGLNSTQQTAIAVNRMNADRAVTAAKNTAKDTIGTNTDNAVFSMENEKATKISDIETAARDTISGIRQSYDQNAMDNAVSQYNKEVEAATDLQKKALEIANETEENRFKGWNNETYETDDAGDETGRITYTDATGKKVTVEKGVNPYADLSDPNVLSRNNDIFAGTFSRAYQPDNIDGNKLGVVQSETGTLKDAGITSQEQGNIADKGYKKLVIPWDGILANVYQVKDQSSEHKGQYYVFSVYENRYIPLGEDALQLATWK